MTVDNLVKGKIYFKCVFCDEGQTIPLLETIKYVGKNLSRNANIGMGEDYYLFIDPEEEYQRKIAPTMMAHGYLSNDETRMLNEIIIPESSMDYIYNIDGIIEMLNRVRGKLL